MQKQHVFLLLCIFFIGKLNALCNELFFSEYVEGYYNNKALEIYNPTAKSIDLKDYRITTWHNGTAAFIPWYSDTLFGNLEANRVLVIVINKRDSTATGLDTIVSKPLRTKANIWLSQNKYACMSLNFNGDDPVTLEKKVNNQWQFIDIIGKIGEQPQIASSPTTTIGWSDSLPYNNGKGMVYTKDHTLVRKPGIMAGISANPAAFNPTKEWILLKVNSFDSLGTHRCLCNKYAAAAAAVSYGGITVYPNPAHSFIYISGSSQIIQLSVLDLFGQSHEILGQDIIATQTGLQVDVSKFKSGFYWLQAKDSKGFWLIRSFLIE